MFYIDLGSAATA
jgi:hypothetical protein